MKSPLPPPDPARPPPSPRRWWRWALGWTLLWGGTARAVPLAPQDSSGGVRADDHRLQYEGRTVAEPDGSVRLGFPGVTVRVKFRGASLALRARASAGPQFLDVSLDGGPFTPLALRAGEATYPLAAGAGPGAHELVLVRRNESWQGIITLAAFEPAPGGGLLPPPSLPARKLLFIGDSVTCGEMTAFEAGRDFHDRRNSNARLSYGMILARRLGAQCALVSYGGRGLIRDWQGRRDTGTAPEFYGRALPDDSGARWDPRRYLPDAVGIQLGTNDFSQGIPPAEEFVDAYLAFIRTIRGDAPRALIFLMNSPILTDTPGAPRRSALDADLAQVVARAGDPRVILGPLRHEAGVPGNGHPTGREHEDMADELEPRVRHALGW
ncbi:MAG TPA: GDSL-type esterase/lipase family protein [Opitutaceae bacterium]|jgi:hypothetical protein|nr:GDSL-type esterase/lipase family protein [Opitutaceae bacterium]